MTESIKIIMSKGSMNIGEGGSKLIYLCIGLNSWTGLGLHYLTIGGTLPYMYVQLAAVLVARVKFNGYIAFKRGADFASDNQL